MQSKRLNKANLEQWNQIFDPDRLAMQVKRGSWFGEGTEYDKLVNGNYTTYAKPDLLKRLIETAKESVRRNNIQVQSRKLRYNDRGRGVFSFRPSLDGSISKNGLL